MCTFFSLFIACVTYLSRWIWGVVWQMDVTEHGHWSTSYHCIILSLSLTLTLCNACVSLPVSHFFSFFSPNYLSIYRSIPFSLWLLLSFHLFCLLWWEPALMSKAGGLESPFSSPVIKRSLPLLSQRCVCVRVRL